MHDLLVPRNPVHSWYSTSYQVPRYPGTRYRVHTVPSYGTRVPRTGYIPGTVPGTRVPVYVYHTQVSYPVRVGTGYPGTVRVQYPVPGTTLVCMYWYRYPGTLVAYHTGYDTEVTVPKVVCTVLVLGPQTWPLLSLLRWRRVASSADVLPFLGLGGHTSCNSWPMTLVLSIPPLLARACSEHHI